MTAETIVPVPAEWSARAKVNAAQYADMYRRSLDDPDGFWTEHGRRLDWIAPFATVSRWSFDGTDFGIKLFEGGVLHFSANCIDRHLATNANPLPLTRNPEHTKPP